VYLAIRVANLDPYPGNLHAPDYGRYALVMDLMEEFRVIIADTLCLSLFNLGILKQQDFVQVRQTDAEYEEQIDIDGRHSSENGIIKDRFGLMSVNDTSEFFDVPEQRFSEDGVDPYRDDKGKLPVQLTKEALKKVISGFEKKLQTEFYYEPLERKISYERAILEQVRQYRRVVEGESKTYVPLVLK
jgi:CRISPR-associated protein Cas1